MELTASSEVACVLLLHDARMYIIPPNSTHPFQSTPKKPTNSLRPLPFLHDEICVAAAAAVFLERAVNGSSCFHRQSSSQAYCIQHAVLINTQQPVNPKKVPFGPSDECLSVSVPNCLK